MDGQTRATELLGLLAPFFLWGLAFVALYAAHGSLCASGADPAAPVWRVALSLLFLLFVGAHAWLCAWFWRRLRSAGPGPARFLRAASFGLSLAALGAVVWTGAPVLFLGICR